MSHASNLIAKRALHLARLWAITRTDSTVLRCTDHNRKLTVNGNEYTPIGSLNVSAVSRRDGLQDVDIQIDGPLASGAITLDDIRAGLYRGATLTESLIDWRMPWLTTIATHTYGIATMQWDAERWQARAIGLTRLLQRPIGRACARDCPWTLGDDNCGVTLASYTNSDTVDAATDRRTFTLTTASDADDYYRYGYVEFNSGANNGLRGEIAGWTQATKQVVLELPMPYDIAAGDTLDITAGCDRDWSTCKDKFSNGDNHGGFPFMPGTDAALETE
jgi:uncharacterized phage protein (TIGR02218 family)